MFGNSAGRGQGDPQQPDRASANCSRGQSVAASRWRLISFPFDNRDWRRDMIEKGSCVLRIHSATCTVQCRVSTAPKACPGKV